ncbi:MAG: hypothetical protein NTX53_09060, partial [candidate division WOR-3 bacterium]|nr:hypothetical protein [candidate division WOR-3 bacterium]
CYNPQQNRVYVPCYDASTITVLRDSMPNGVEESPKPQTTNQPRRSCGRFLPERSRSTRWGGGP